MTLTVGITTRHRPDALRRCVASIARYLPDAEVIVFDDGNEPAASEVLDGLVPSMDLRVIRRDDAPGNIVGRNTIVREARHELVLLLDDDAVLLDRAAIERGAEVLCGDPKVAAVAFAQANGDGSPWPEGMQPARGTSPRRITAFIGFAHLLRRSTFLALGGYREAFVFYGEEKDYCLRLLAAGQRVVYLPGARVAHLPDAGGRDHRRYVRYVIRNDCLHSLFNEPWPLVIVSLPVRLWRFFRMSGGTDARGFAWVLRQVWAAFPAVRAGRRPVAWATVRAWRRLQRNHVAYDA